MRRTLLFGTVFAAAMAVSVGAQSGSTQDRESQYGARGKTVTLTGCLQSAGNSSGSTSTTGSTAGSTTSGSMTGSTASSAYGSQKPAGANFVLKDVSMGSEKNPSETSTTTSGATGTTGSTSAISSFSSGLWLIATSSTENWSKYLNHRVEVKGSLSESNSSSPSTTASGSTTSSQTNPSSSYSAQSNMGTLNVTSIKEISGTCSPSQR